jgi:hypothetical protein
LAAVRAEPPPVRHRLVVVGCRHGTMLLKAGNG